MGLHYGELLHRGVDFDQVIQLSKEQITFGMQSLAICEKLVPKLCDEIRGLADGVRFPYETFACWLLTMYGFDDVHGCTCFCFSDRDKTYLARNSDMFPELKSTSESILYRPEQGFAFLGHSTSMVQMEDGLNEQGLSVGMNFMTTKNYKPGLNTGMVVRHILETCKTVNEAVELINQLPLSSTQNIILADKEGNMAVIECSPNRVVVRKLEPADGYLISANHFIDPSMQEEHANPVDNWYLSKDRYATVQKAMNEMPHGKDVAYAQQILSGKLGFICQYEKQLNFDTIWSTVYSLNDLKIFCAEGNPSKVKFKEDTRLLWGIRKSN
jgi:predicted choloylglycine hydrolase